MSCERLRLFTEHATSTLAIGYLYPRPPPVLIVERDGEWWCLSATEVRAGEIVFGPVEWATARVFQRCFHDMGPGGVQVWQVDAEPVPAEIAPEGANREGHARQPR